MVESGVTGGLNVMGKKVMGDKRRKVRGSKTRDGNKAKISYLELF